MSDLTDLRDRMREFTAERDWAKFHDPKSLIVDLMGEVGNWPSCPVATGR